jgi:hypothetical protein
MGAGPMKLKALEMSRVLRLSGILLIAGLLIEAVSLLFNHPLSFIGFIVIGGSVLGIGVILFLVALVEIGQAGSGSPEN